MAELTQDQGFHWHPPCHFYASQLVCLGEKWFLLGTVRDDEGTRISDPLPITADERGLHLE